ncbi:MAG: MFS transporter [Acidimicrobiia bacterium]|jgi:DHA1 family inner membrane transport protein
MTLPARVVQAVRPQASAGVMAGAAVVAATFSATPLLLPDIAAELGLDIGATGLLSTAQVGSFALASFFAGRLFRPRRRFHYGGLLLVALGTLGSALSPNFAILLGTRVIAGVGMGTLTWIAWADATRFPRGLGDVAAVAPLTATIATPVIGWLTETGSYPLVFGVLAGLAVLATLLKVDFGDLPRVGRHVSGSRSNVVLLGALLILSVGGSSVFIFSGAAALEVQGITPLTVSWALSLNALTGVIATRTQARRGTAWVWLVGTAGSALVIGTVVSAPLFFLALAVWGFAFWMAVPAVLRLITERSIHPSERMGDAQAAMATGRVFGPILGGFALGAGQFTRLSITGASIMGVAAMIVAGVEWYRRRSHWPPPS